MTIRSNARIAGLAYLVYIGAAFPGFLLSGRASAGQGTAAKLATLSQHASDVRLAILLFMVGNFCALVLAVTLYAITRDVDPDIALMTLVCRTAEGIVGGVGLSETAGRLWLATGGARALDPASANVLAAVLLHLPGGMEIGATFFAVGSLCFSYLLVRGRLVPLVLGWIGLLASILAVVILPLKLAGFVSGPITEWMWYPMLAFEVPLGFWLIFKGVRTPVARPAA